MVATRLQVKLFVENPGAVELAAFMGVFQRWIQQKQLEGLLIDVVDYRHVFQGPGVVLIGHESDYSMDEGEGRLGLLYTRKRQLDASLHDQIRGSISLALRAALLLENDASLGGKLKFRTDKVEIRFLDRLQFKNTPETLDLVRDDLSAVLADIYGAAVDLNAVNSDPRNVFTIAARAAGNEGVATLVSRLQGSAANA
jgi:hypothetical protein